MAYTLADLVYDRTADDVANRTSKGCYNYTDWNRVIWFESYLAEDLGTEIAGNSQKSLGDIVVYDELSDLLKDAETLRTAKFTCTDTASAITATPNEFNYTAANYVEQILYSKQAAWMGKATERRRAGTSYAGGAFANKFACRKF